MADIFISYKRDDRARCEDIYRRLLDLGFTVWFDARLTPGVAFDKEIETALAEAKAVLVLWSPSAVDSDWVRAEAGDGLERNILCSAKVVNCALPFAFRNIQTIDLTDPSFPDMDPGWQSIVMRLQSLAGQPGADDHALDPSLGDLLPAALHNLAQRAVAGDPSAQSELAERFLTGRGAEQSEEEALRWARLSAAQGDPDGLHTLAGMTLSGRGVAVDQEEAARLFRQAAEQGSVRSQYNMGVLHEHGLGVPQDLQKARAYYAQAAEQGDADAKLALDRLGS